MSERKLTKEMRDCFRKQCEAGYASRCPTTMEVRLSCALDDLDAADAEIERLRNALRMALHRYMDGATFSSSDEDELVAVGALNKDKCWITEEE